MQELVERLAPLIDSLTPREKLVLSLYYTDELNMRETAEVMGITEGRVSQLHSQALNRLRREFMNQYGEGSEL
jgi:RNA polymerase sigma factor for flagellar operon FliA